MLRRIDELGRIVLPAEMREQLHIAEKDFLEITVQGNSLILSKAADSCIFCKSTDNLAKLNNLPVCETCRQRLAEMQTGDTLYPVQAE